MFSNISNQSYPDTTGGSASSNPGLYPMIMERLILHCVFSPIIILVGIVGNIMTLLVLCQLNEKTTATLFLSSLAISDTATLGLRSIYMVYAWAQIFIPEEMIKWTLNSYTFFKLSHVTERISKLTLVAIVIERVLAVHLPLQLKSICTRSRVSKSIIIIYLITMASSLPNNIDIIIYDYNKESSVKEHPMIQKDASDYFKGRLHKSTIRMVHSTINRVVLDFLPIPIVIICNIAIIFGLRRSNDLENSTHQSNRRANERKLTRLLLSVSLCFLVLCGPFDVYSFSLLTGTFAISNKTLVMSEVFKIATLMNSSINFIIYAFMNKKYRQKYIDIVLCNVRQRQHGPRLHIEDDSKNSGASSFRSNP